MHRHLGSFALSLVLLLGVPGAWAGYFDGMFAFDRGDFPTALKEWSASGRLGEPKSLHGLGQLYEEGAGVPADPVRAYVYYDLAAIKGFRRAASARAAVAGKLSTAQLARAKGVSASLRRSGRFVVEDADLAGSAAPPAARVIKKKAFRETQPARVPAPTRPSAVARPKPAKPLIKRKTQPVPAPALVKLAAPAPRLRRLDIAYACGFKLRWRDKGSGGESDVALYAPLPPGGYSSVGGYAQGNYGAPDSCVLVLKDLGGKGPPLLAPPRDWRSVWTDKGSGAAMDGSIWQALPPSADYVCLGSVGQTGYRRPNPPNYACVHKCLVTQLRPSAPVWTDRGTGARQPVALFKLYASNSVHTVRGRKPPPELVDLNPFAACAYE